MACTDRRSDLGRRDPRPAGAQRLSDRTEGRIDAQTRNEIDDDRDFRLTMQTCVAALRLPGRMSVERVAGCWWTGWPDGVECAANRAICADNNDFILTQPAQFMYLNRRASGARRRVGWKPKGPRPWHRQG